MTIIANDSFLNTYKDKSLNVFKDIWKHELIEYGYPEAKTLSSSYRIKFIEIFKLATEKDLLDVIDELKSLDFKVTKIC